MIFSIIEHLSRWVRINKLTSRIINLINEVFLALAQLSLQLFPHDLEQFCLDASNSPRNSDHLQTLKHEQTGKQVRRVISRYSDQYFAQVHVLNL